MLPHLSLLPNLSLLRHRLQPLLMLLLLLPALLPTLLRVQLLRLVLLLMQPKALLLTQPSTSLTLPRSNLAVYQRC